jgi:hypothetical protein
MAKVLYLHGSSVGPSGRKTEWLEGHGHPVVGRPRLPYPRHRRGSWRWVIAFFDRRWFSQAVAVAQDAYDRTRPDIIVGSSMGGAVAMNLRSGDTPQVLVAPAWKAWPCLHFGRARTVKPATVILHGERDRLIPPAYSRQLLASGPQHPAAGLIGQELALRLDRDCGGGCRVVGRLVVLEGEVHRCDSEAVLRALSAAVEVLADPVHLLLTAVNKPPQSHHQ